MKIVTFDRLQDGQVKTDLSKVYKRFSNNVDFGKPVNIDVLEASFDCLMYFTGDLEFSENSCYAFAKDVLSKKEYKKCIVYEFDIFIMSDIKISVPQKYLDMGGSVGLEYFEDEAFFDTNISKKIN